MRRGSPATPHFGAVTGICWSESVKIKVATEVAGKVWKIEAAVGQQVAADDTLMLIESMKMEIPVAAPRAGTIIEILVAEGDPVAEGQAVVLLD